MKTIIAGSRSINNQDMVDRILDTFDRYPITEVVCGKALGVDTCGEDWAKRNGIPVIPFKADWKNVDVPGAVIRRNRYGTYNAIAGHMRNEDMAVYGEALISIWDGISTGSNDMLKRAMVHKLMITQYVVTATGIQRLDFNPETGEVLESKPVDPSYRQITI